VRRCQSDVLVLPPPQQASDAQRAPLLPQSGQQVAQERLAATASISPLQP
jgi:hypothetical protein